VFFFISSISKIWKNLAKTRNLAEFTLEKNSNYFFQEMENFCQEKTLLKTQISKSSNGSNP
jgi:hypothetical protein